MEAVSGLCELLQSHPDRDKVVCLTSYVLKLWGATSKKQSLLTASARLASARATLRLFDDCAGIKTTVNYGFGTQEGKFWGTLGVAGNSLNLLYLQLEKVIFLLDCGVLTLNKNMDSKVRVLHKLLWSLSAAVGLIRSINTLHASASELKSPTRRKCAQPRFTQSSLQTTKLIFDVVHSVSWLPDGWLWGGRLSPGQMGAVATASASVALVMHYNGKRLAPKR